MDASIPDAMLSPFLGEIPGTIPTEIPVAIPGVMSSSIPGAIPSTIPYVIPGYFPSSNFTANNGVISDTMLDVFRVQFISKKLA